MRYRRLDANGDYSMGHGQADYLVNTPQTVAQAVQTRLNLFLGQWFLNTADGTPWNTAVLGRNAKATADLAIQARVLGTPGVTGIATFASTLLGRVYTITNLRITTIYDNGADPG